MSLLSKSCLYGIRAAIYVASRKLEPGGFVSIGEISNDLGISFHFLTKILQVLTEQKIMVSYRGPKGGVALAKPSNEITLLNIVESIDSPTFFKSCVLGLEGCGDKHPCPLHEQWAVERARLRDLFEHTSLADLSTKVSEMNLRLSNG